MSDLHVFTLVIIPKKNVLCGCDAISRMLKWHCDNLEEFLSLYHKHSKREIDIFNNEEKTLFDFEITQDCNAENRACLLRTLFVQVLIYVIDHLIILKNQLLVQMNL